MEYLELKVSLIPQEPWGEILVAQLAEIGFESFMEFEEGILAYGQTNVVSLEQAIAESFLSDENSEVSFKVDSKVIPHENWNAVWESDFDPVFVEDYLTILAPFHDPKLAKGLTVIVQPQMSFGTGHHQTTWMMSKALFEFDSIPANVLDMGTGTGVLAIIAEKLGAKNILAIDIEDWSVENTIENAVRNKCKLIEAVCGDVDLINGKSFEMILANINKNILKAHMKSYSNALTENGTLMLSGFFDSDVDEIVKHAEQFRLQKKHVLNKDNWAAVQLIKL